MSSFTQELLRREYSKISRGDTDGFSVGLDDESNYFSWKVCIEGPPGTFYEGGIYTAILTFPENYPNSPPQMRFEQDMWHPNIFSDGRVCISTLHPPGIDEYNEQETAAERWRPCLSVESILLSVISILGEPNLNSPANVSAAEQLSKNFEEYKKKVRAIARKTVLDD